MKNTKISQILKQLLADKKIRVAELARRINLPQPTIHRIVAGTCEHPHLSSLDPIANYFSITVEQLKGHEPIQKLDRVANIPLLTWHQAVGWPENKLQLRDNERIVTDANIGINGYALRIFDVSMDPVFPKSTLLIIDPEKSAKDRSYVIAKLQSHEEPIFRQLLMDASDRYLKALSPDLNRYKMIFLEKIDKILGVVIQAKKDFE